MSAVVPVARIFTVPAPRAVFATFTTMRLAIVACVVLSGGILASILTTTDPLWWHLHFSRLGTFHDVSGALFNGSLITAGSVVVMFGHRVRRDLARIGRAGSRRGTAVTAQVLLSTIGINLAMVGFVPLNTNKTLHDNVAAGMVLGFAGLLLTSPFMMHRMPRRLVATTAAIFVLLFCGAWLFVSATINLALFEVIAFGAMFAWSGVFTHCLSIRGTATRAISDPPRGAASDASRAHRPTRRVRRAPAILRAPRRLSRPAGSAPSGRRVVLGGARGRPRRGGTGWAAPAASARSMTRDRRSPRWPAAER